MLINAIVSGCVKTYDRLRGVPLCGMYLCGCVALGVAVLWLIAGVGPVLWLLLTSKN